VREQPSLALRLWAAWTESDGSIAWARSSGAAWDAVEQAFEPGTTTHAPALGSLEEYTGGIFGWMAWRSASDQVLASYQRGPDPWAAGVPVASTVTTETAPSIEALERDAGDRFIWVAWARNASVYWVKTDGVAAFSTPQQLAGATSAKGRPALGSFRIR
jgi:hypothetical protein